MLLRSLVAVGSVVVLVIACSSDTQSQVSQRGEGCERHADCGSSLACVGGVCTEGRFDVPPTGKECVKIECTQDSDCCTESATCLSYRDLCAGGDNAACVQAGALCTCGNTHCQDSQCTVTCDDTNPCPSGRFCESGECVECQCDAHCGSGQVCKDARCTTQCSRDADCPRFYRCEDQQCIESGCSSDRECIAALHSVLAFCESGECFERCSSDVECGDAEHFNFRACVEGTCRDVGCSTDEECRASLALNEGWSGLAECRAKAAPRPEGVPGVGGSDCPTVCDDSCIYANNGLCDDPSSCDPGTDCTDCRCGNGLLEAGEQCDGRNVGSSTCATVTGDPSATGTPTCTTSCNLSTSGCILSGSYCGDGIVNGVGEQCDTFDFAGATCSSVTGGVLPYGTLNCDFACSYDISGCTASSGYCGDGFQDPGEDCDGYDLGGETCSTATSGLYPVGTLGCSSSCTFDTTSCTGGYCGDGVAGLGEACDGFDLGGETCSTATSGLYPVGTLGCSGSCTFDTTSCTSAAYCGDGVADLGEECDGTDFAGETCSTVTGGVRTTGTLYCSGCIIDATACARTCDTCVYANDGFCDDPGSCATGTDCSDCCTDTCVYANDGFCDEPSLCAPATDCTDCGG